MGFIAVIAALLAIKLRDDRPKVQAKEHPIRSIRDGIAFTFSHLLPVALAFLFISGIGMLTAFSTITGTALALRSGALVSILATVVLFMKRKKISRDWEEYKASSGT